MQKVLFNSDVNNLTSSFFFRLDELTLIRFDMNKENSIIKNIQDAIRHMQEYGYANLHLYLSIVLKHSLDKEEGEKLGLEPHMNVMKELFPHVSVTWTIPDYLKGNIK